MTHVRRNCLHATASLAAIACSALAFEQVAFDDGPGGGWTDSQCVFTLDNETQLIIDCQGNESCDCKDFLGYTCSTTDPCHAVVTCARICNLAGQVVSGECKCICLYREGGYTGVPGFEDFCPTKE